QIRELLNRKLKFNFLRVDFWCGHWSLTFGVVRGEEDSIQPFPTEFVKAKEEVRNQNPSLDLFSSLSWAQRTYSCKLAPP
ncbi:hypothetical protein NC651_028785, partial [Populus alba x Populus x berolinensis]